MKPSHPLTEESVKIARALAPYGTDIKAIALALNLGAIHPNWRISKSGDISFWCHQDAMIFYIYGGCPPRFVGLEQRGAAVKWTSMFGTAAALLKRYGVDP